MRNRPSFAVVAPLILALAGCTSGGGNTAGDQQDMALNAVATAIGYVDTDASPANVAIRVRSMSEVLVTGKDSDDPDDPVTEFTWSVADDGGVGLTDSDLILRNRSTVSFRAPAVAEQHTLRLQLSVRNADGDSATADVNVTVVPTWDSDRFLRYPDQGGSFGVVATTVDPLASGGEFRITVAKQLHYRPRDASAGAQVGNECAVPAASPARTAFATPVVLESVTGSWNAGAATVGAAAGAEAAVAAPQNPRYYFDLPGVDADDVNSQFRTPDGGNAGLQMKPSDIDDAFLELHITLEPLSALDSGVALLIVDENGRVIDQAVGAGGPATVVIDADRLRPGSDRRATAQKYYCAIDPEGERVTLAAWLTKNGFDPAAEDFGADPVEQPDDTPHAIYLNNYDLGFGRDMYMRTRPTVGCTNGMNDVSGVVINYPTLEAATKQVGPIIAVAMEYALKDPAGDACDPLNRMATFYAYAPDDDGDADNDGSPDTVQQTVDGQPRAAPAPSFRRVLSANFDGRGEKYIPGACTVCHGGAPASELVTGDVYPDRGDVGATFMPWDLDSFLYASDSGAVSHADPAYSPRVEDAGLRNRYSRQNQEAALKAFNRIALSTYPDPERVVDVNGVETRPFAGYSAPRELVTGWYGGETLPQEFDGGFVPAGWLVDGSGSVAPRDLYLNVLAQNCRACHLQQVHLASTEVSDPDTQSFGPGVNQLGSWADFVVLAGGGSDDPSSNRILNEVFRKGSMPGSRLTMDRMWVDWHGSQEAPAQLLTAALQEIAALPSPPSPPLEPVVSPRLAEADITGVGSACVDPADGLAADRECELGSWVRINARPTALIAPGELRWSLQRFAGGDCDNGAPLALAAATAGGNSAEFAFRPDEGGLYCAAVASAQEPDQPIKSWRIWAPDRVPVFRTGPALTVTPLVGQSVRFTVSQAGTDNPLLAELGDGGVAGHSIVAVNGAEFACPSAAPLAGTNGAIECSRDADGVATLEFVPTGTTATQDGAFSVAIGDLNATRAQLPDAVGVDPAAALTVQIDYQASVAAETLQFEFPVNTGDAPVTRVLDVLGRVGLSSANGWVAVRTGALSRTSLTPSYVPAPYRAGVGSATAEGAEVTSFAYDQPSRVATMARNASNTAIFRGADPTQDQISFPFELRRYQGGVLLEQVPGFAARISLASSVTFAGVLAELSTCTGACHSSAAQGSFNSFGWSGYTDAERHREIFELQGTNTVSPGASTTQRARLHSPSASHLIVYPAATHGTRGWNDSIGDAILLWINQGAFEAP